MSNLKVIKESFFLSDDELNTILTNKTNDYKMDHKLKIHKINKSKKCLETKLMREKSSETSVSLMDSKVENSSNSRKQNL